MGKSEKHNEFSIIKEIITSLKSGDIPPYSRFNLYFTLVSGVIVLGLSVQPVLALVENIIISLGNVFIALFTEREISPRTDDSALLSLIACLAFLLLEMIACRVYCYFAQKINSKP